MPEAVTSIDAAANRNAEARAIALPDNQRASW
jgi:hypothetical protein